MTTFLTRSTSSLPALPTLISFFHSLHSHFCSCPRFLEAKPSRPTYLYLLKSSSSTLPSLIHGLSLHAHILKNGFRNDIIMTTSLINRFSDFSDTNSARKLFDEMPERDVASWNSMLSGYSRNGCLDEALSLFRAMASCRITKLNLVTLSVMLRVCGGLGDMRLGRSVHGYLLKSFEPEDASLGNSLIAYYNKFGDLYMSESVFQGMVAQNIVSWNSMMSGCIKNGRSLRALEWFQFMMDRGISPDIATFEIVLQACGQIGEAAIIDGELIHGRLIRSGFHKDVYVENSLLLMYCKCGKLEESGRCLFNSMEFRNLVSWSIIIHGYVWSKNPANALTLFRCAFNAESTMSSELLVAALQATRIIGECVQQVMLIHCLSIKKGFISDAFVGSSLVAAYGDSGEVEFALRCLDFATPEGKNQLVFWNSMLSVCARHGYFDDSVELLHRMKLQGCFFDTVTLVNIVSLCTRRGDLESGKAAHGYIIRNNFDSDVFVTSSLLELYIKCGRLIVACYLFSKMTVRTLATWNTLIHGCVQNDFHRASLRLFYLMQQRDGFEPDTISMAGAVEAIALRGYEQERNYIHHYAVQQGFINNDFVANSLISMHAKVHDFDKASMAFAIASKESSATWNTIINEYSSVGLVDKAVSLFHLMKLNNIAPDSITLLSLVRGILTLRSFDCTQWIHAVICKSGYGYDVRIRTSLIDLYAKCGELSMARQIFDDMSFRTTISWNTMIQGYGVHGNLEEASKLFFQMRDSGLEPTRVTFLILLSMCSHVGDVVKGQEYFDLMTKSYSFPPVEEHLSCYIDLIGRSGLVKEAYNSLERMGSDPGIFAWGSLLGACRLHGNSEVGLAAARKLFDLDPLQCGHYALLSNIISEAERWVDASHIKLKLGRMGIKKLRGWSIVE